MIEIVAQSCRFPVLYEGFRGSSAERGDRLGAILRHGLILAARPAFDTPHDLEHLLEACLGPGRGDPIRAIEGLEVDPGRLGGLGLGQPERFAHALDRNGTLDDVTRDRASPSGDFFAGISPSTEAFERSRDGLSPRRVIFLLASMPSSLRVSYGKRHGIVCMPVLRFKRGVDGYAPISSPEGQGNRI